MKKYVFILALCVSACALHAADDGSDDKQLPHELEQSLAQVINDGGCCADLEPDDFEALGWLLHEGNERAWHVFEEQFSFRLFFNFSSSH